MAKRHHKKSPPPAVQVRVASTPRKVLPANPKAVPKVRAVKKSAKLAQLDAKRDD